MQIHELERTFVYHSPQYPGFTSWVGLWNMPDGSIMCSFIQATGPLVNRPKAPENIRKYLSWPPAGHGDEYDMTGLDLRHVHLRSTDFARTWTLVSSIPFTSCMNGAPGEVEEVIPDESAEFGGVILRGIWGPYLPYDNDLPENGFIERSTDGSRSWGPPEVIYDEKNTMFQLKRIRPLRDGRILAGGGLYFTDPKNNYRYSWHQNTLQAFFVSDSNGTNWRGPIPVTPDHQVGQFSGEEFDWVELENGDILCVLRTQTVSDNQQATPTEISRSSQQRRITRLVKTSESWEATAVDIAPFPHSGHPEMLRTREGIILHVATSGISGSNDEGESWTHLDLTPQIDWHGWCGPGSPYYPKAVHMPNGEILVLGHVGGDNGYGTIDQSIVGMSFRLDM